MIVLVAATFAQAASTVQFAASSYTVAESAGTVSLAVQRSNDTDTEVSVDYATADGTATNGWKYSAVSSTLAFGAGETSKTIVVPILNEGFVEGTKTFQVILSNPTNTLLGTRASATVSIMDNDAGVQFVFATYSVAEDAGEVVVGVVRGDDGNLPVTVDLTTTDLTAASGVDYTSTSTMLSFGPTERLKLVPIPILNNTLKQANRTFRVSLSRPTGATLGTQKTATVTIVDNDQGLQFASATCAVAEDCGRVLIPVLRGADDTNTTVAVDYSIHDLTATNGLDYAVTNGTLFFAPEEKVKLIPITILNNGNKDGTRSFRLSLSGPRDQAVLGWTTNITVSILDNDPGVGFERTRYTNSWGEAGGITLTVLRGNDWALGPIAVDYATSDLTAIAGTHYQAVSGTLEFKANETVKTITVPLLQPRAPEGWRSFRVTLSNPAGGAALGASSTTVDIVGAYFTVAPGSDPGLAIRSDQGVHTLSWNGDGQLQRADRVDGPWQTLTAAKSPWTVQSPVPTTFYRVARARPVNLYVPSTYDGHAAVPLVILLHGGHWSGDLVEDYMRLRPQAESHRFLYCYPTGTLDLMGSPFWNAYFEDPADAAAFGMTAVDDVGYLQSLIEEVASHFALDRKRVYLIGHSNGGFMAYLMACRSADSIAGIASLAGTSFLVDWRHCQPAEPVNILHINGTADDSLRYWGGALTPPSIWCNSPPFAGAVQQVQTWAGYNGASNPVTDPAATMDLDLAVPGLDTVVTRYTSSPPGGAVELWTINGGTHVPTFYNGAASSEFASRVINWLLAHPKP
jgi:poly(3-hydroxybutyrate) depolymerase